MANKKKLATAAVALGTAAALMLGGTFAWQSINQTALNEASDIVNPGGRLHNDMWYETAQTTNSDIYVENFAEEPIYARVQLSEYFEITMNYGKGDVERTETLAGSKTLKETPGDTDDTGKNLYDYKYAIHYFGLTDEEKEAGTASTADGEVDNKAYTYWDWAEGNVDSELPYFMPTFNKNKDSLAPDLNGLYRDRVGGISNREAAQYVNTDGEALINYPGYEAYVPETWNAIYDADANSVDELEKLDAVALADIIKNGENTTTSYDVDAVKLVNESHTTQQVGVSNGLISMTDWLALNNGTYSEATHGNYWVYDKDGWVYWSSAIPGVTDEGKVGTTGLLLDSFTLNQVMDDTWYYAIQVTGQFVTADDMGSAEDQSGFYTPDENGNVSAPSEDALKLLEEIGVDVDGSGSTGGEGEEPEIKADGVHLSVSQPVGVALSETGIYYYEAAAPETATTETWQLAAELWADGAEVTEDVTYTYEITEAELFGGAPEIVDGKQTFEGYFTFDTTTGELTTTVEKDGLEYFDLTVTVTAANSAGDTLGTNTVKLLRAVPISIYTYDYANNSYTTETSDTVAPGETVYAIYHSECQSYGNAARMVGEPEYVTGCDCLTITESEGLFTITHSEDGTCNGEGAVIKLALIDDYSIIDAEYTVYCSETGGSSDNETPGEEESDWIVVINDVEVDDGASIIAPIGEMSLSAVDADGAAISGAAFTVSALSEGTAIEGIEITNNNDGTATINVTGEPAKVNGNSERGWKLSVTANGENKTIELKAFTISVNGGNFVGQYRSSEMNETLSQYYVLTDSELNDENTSQNNTMVSVFGATVDDVNFSLIQIDGTGASANYTFETAGGLTYVKHTCNESCDCSGIWRVQATLKNDSSVSTLSACEYNSRVLVFDPDGVYLYSDGVTRQSGGSIGGINNQSEKTVELYLKSFSGKTIAIQNVTTTCEKDETYVVTYVLNEDGGVTLTFPAGASGLGVDVEVSDESGEYSGTIGYSTYYKTT